MKKQLQIASFITLFMGVLLSGHYVQKQFEKPTAPELRILAAAEDFVLEYVTTSANQSIVLPFRGATNVVIDFNDGTTPVSRTIGNDMTYTYAVPGTYQIKITGTMTGYGSGSSQFNTYSVPNKLLTSVLQWGDTGVTSLSGALFDTDNLIYVPADLPSTVTDLSFLFRNKSANWTGLMSNISTWDTSNVTNFQSTFHGAIGFGNDLDITGWDTSSATTMREMFNGASSFNQNISSWNVGLVQDMVAMFERATVFNQPIGSWNVSNVSNMSLMFRFVGTFNHPLNTWNVSQVTNFSSMFYGASAFNQDLNLWDTSSATDMNVMFRDATVFNGNITNWDVSNVTQMNQMFSGARAFNQAIGNWDVTNVTMMLEMFYFATTFNQDISSWNVGNVINFSAMFNRASAFNQPLNTWDTSKGVNFSSMFEFNAGFNQPIGQWNVSLGTNFSNMFAYSIFNQDISTWNVGSARFMNNMFRSNAVYNQPLNTWNVANVENMERMFSSATAFNQPLDQWNVGKVTNMFSMFENASVFNHDISSWDVSKVTQFGGMFNNADAFNQPIGSWNTASALSMSEMFANNAVFDQYIGEWDTSKVTNFAGMFNFSVFNQDIGGWDTSSGQYFQSMFRFNDFFNQDLSGWNMGNAQYIFEMFYNAKLFNSPLNTWNTGKVIQAHRLFEGATVFNQPLDTWDMSKNETTYSMFANAKAFNQDLPWITTALVNASEMFNGATAFNGQVETFDMSKVLFVNNFFQNASSFNQPIPAWNFAAIIPSNGFERMFNGAASFNQDISGWTFGRVTNFRFFMSGVNLNPLYYDAFLQAMIDQNVVIDLAFGERQVDFGLSKYSKVAKALKDQLVADFGWTIRDGGQLNLTITVDDTEKFFGEEDPDFTVSYDGLVEGAGEDTLTNAFVFTRDPGEEVDDYIVTVTGGDESYYYVTYAPGTFSIVKPTIDLDLITWDYDESFTYDGTTHSVSLLNVPSTLNVTYTNNSATNAGDYEASVTYTYDMGNYEIIGTIPTLTWTIQKADVDVSQIVWDYDGDFVYTGQPITVVVSNVPSELTPQYESNTATNVGDYTASVTFTYDTDNYRLIGVVAPLEWFIIPATYDMSNASWDYDGPLTYDLTEKTVTVIGLPDGVTAASYTGNTATDPGTYTASVSFAYDTLNYEEPVLASLTWSIVAETYTLTFDTRGGSSIAPIRGIVGSPITIPNNPTREGYIFNGWNQTIPTTMPADNITFRAGWLVLNTDEDVTDTDLSTIIDLGEFAGEDIDVSLIIDVLDETSLSEEAKAAIREAYEQQIGSRSVNIVPVDLKIQVESNGETFVIETINGQLVISLVLPEQIVGEQFGVMVLENGVWVVIESIYDANTRTISFEVSELGQVMITYQTPSGFAWWWFTPLALLMPLFWFFFVGKKKKQKEKIHVNGLKPMTPSTTSSPSSPVITIQQTSSDASVLALPPIHLSNLASRKPNTAGQVVDKGQYLELTKSRESTSRLIDVVDTPLPKPLQPSNIFVALTHEESARLSLNGLLLGGTYELKTPGTYVKSDYYAEVNQERKLVGHVIYAKTRLAPTSQKGHRWVRIQPRQLTE